MIVINVQPRHSERASRFFRFFFEADRFALSIELNYAITFRVAYLVAKNACATLDRERMSIEIEFSVENVVTQNERRAGVVDEFRANQKCLRDSFRFRLLGILDVNTELFAIAQIILQHRQIFWRRDDQHFAKSAEHQSRQRIANHRLVVNRQKLFADDFRQRVKTCPRAAGEQNGLFHFRF